MSKKKYTFMAGVSALALLVACQGPETSQTSSTNSVTSDSSVSSSELDTSSQDSSATSNETTSSTSQARLQGSGTRVDPYLITSKDDLMILVEESNQKKHEYIPAIADLPFYKLTVDIDLNNEEWTPIGAYVNDDYETFGLNFDGDGHTISNLSIQEFDYDILGYGFFGSVHGYIHDVNISSVNIDISNINSSATNYLGGLVGYAYNCAFENINVIGGSINYTHTGSAQAVIGGLAGYSIVSSNNASYARFIKTDVDIESNAETTFAGGLFGYGTTASGQGTMAYSYIITLGNINTTYLGGGILGYMDFYSNIAYSYSRSTIRTSYFAGGLVAYATADTLITNCFYAGALVSASTAQLNGSYTVGGIVGSYSPESDPEVQQLSTLIKDTYLSSSSRIAKGSTSATDTTVPQFTSDQLKTITIQENALEFTNTEFTLVEGQYPEIKSSNSLDDDTLVNVTFVTNMEGVTKADGSKEKYYYSSLDTSVSKEGYTFVGWFYDEACTMEYRFYAPAYENLTLYGKWANYAEFSGLFVPSSENRYQTTGKIDFDNKGNVTWFYNDLSYNRGSYAYYNDYIYFETNTTIVDGGWGLTYGLYDDSNNTLRFNANDASSTTFIYERANEIVGRYKLSNGLYLDFYTNSDVKLVNGTQETSYKYTYSSSTISIASLSTISAITIQDTDTLLVTYNDNVITGTRESDIRDYSDQPFIGKKYNSLFFNAEQTENYAGKYKVRNMTFFEDGNVYLERTYASNPTYSKYDVTSATDSSVVATAGYTSTANFITTVVEYKYELVKEGNSFGLYYSGTETQNGILTYEIPREKVYDLTRVSGTEGLQGIYQGQKTPFSATNSIEITIDESQLSIKQFTSYNVGGGYYMDDNNNIVISCDSGSYGYEGVVTYNTENDYFTLKDGTRTFLLAPYEMIGIYAVDEFGGGEIYAYDEKVYFVSTLGEITEITSGVQGDFENGSTVTITIGQETNTYSVINLFATDTLTLTSN